MVARERVRMRGRRKEETFVVGEGAGGLLVHELGLPSEGAGGDVLMQGIFTKEITVKR